MIRIIPSADRYHKNFGWLDARWHFSFGDYHDPKNLHFSSLRVFNDDVIGPGGGFDMHPHRDMEIVTIMVHGQLRHRDSLGNNELLQSSDVQAMSAGRGVVHSEFNDSATEPLRLMQLWILPRNKDSDPKHAVKSFDRHLRQGFLQPIVSDGSIDNTLHIDQDAVVYLADLPTGVSVTHDSAARSVYVFVVNGSITLNGQPLQNGDQARITNEADLTLTGVEPAEILLIDLT